MEEKYINIKSGQKATLLGCKNGFAKVLLEGMKNPFELCEMRFNKVYKKESEVKSEELSKNS